MKLTLLNVVQSYLNRVSDFYVNSIFDSESAQQAATIAEEVYYSMTQRFRDWEFTSTLSTLDGVSDPTKPNYLKLPDGLQRLHGLTLSYNKSTDLRSINYQNIEYLEPHTFLQMMEQRSEQADYTEVVEDFGGTKFVVYNNTYPRYWTCIDGKHVIFDSYNAEYEDTLQESKSRAVYNKEDVFLQADDFVIPIPEHLSELYRDAVIIECYEHLLQQPAPPSMTRRMASRMATAQQQERKTGSMNRGKRLYGR